MELKERQKNMYIFSTGEWEGGWKDDGPEYHSNISNVRFYLSSNQTEDCHFSMNQMDDSPGFIVHMNNVIVAEGSSLVVPNPPKWLKNFISVLYKFNILVRKTITCDMPNVPYQKENK